MKMARYHQPSIARLLVRRYKAGSFGMCCGVHLSRDRARQPAPTISPIASSSSTYRRRILRISPSMTGYVSVRSSKDPKNCSVRFDGRPISPAVAGVQWKGECLVPPLVGDHLL